MATLVLSTVGTMLGGPVGGAIGSLLGQSIDQQLFGPGPRHGPRLGDLAVQSSSYGTPIPRLFGKIRVAGSIIWSTDLKEDSQTTGAKGQPDTVTYSYSVSFAVALSCRRVNAIKRIWADGKLLRGANGDFKVSTGFRLHDGNEDQPADPLIASIEGIGATPAYRGLAVAVFENLQLAEYGNRIPFLTFEVEADAQSPSVGEVLHSASAGAIDCVAPALLPGYAAYGGTVAAAVRPLTDHFAVELFDDGAVLRAPAAGAVAADEADLGCSAGMDPAPRRQRTQAAAAALPSVLLLSYYDPQRDYQTAQMRASVASGTPIVRAAQLPAVIGSAAAKALAQRSLARSWAQRELLTLRLPPSALGLEPGQRIEVPGEAGPWTAVRVTVDGMAVLVELHPAADGVDSLPADPGRVLPPKDVMPEPTALAMVELPSSIEEGGDKPVVVIASASSAAVPLDVEVAGAQSAMQTARKAAVIGQSATVLAAGPAGLADLVASVEVELADPERWLASCDDAALAAGANLAMVGRELIQFGDATPLSPGRFRLSRLLRGRRGTEWAAGSHGVGEPFVLIEPHALRQIPLTAGQAGAPASATPRGIGDVQPQSAALTVSGEALRPPSPVHLRATIAPDGAADCSWVRRSRLGWAWPDGVDAPLGAFRELYRARLQGAQGAIEAEADRPAATFAGAAVAAIGPGPLILTVVQVGDLAVSHPATITISQD